MLIANALITSYRQQSSPRGDGRPTLGTDFVTSPTRPISCIIDEPSLIAQQTAAARGVAIDRVCRLLPAEVAHRNLTPSIGDRLVITLDRSGAESRTYVVTRVRERAPARIPGRIDPITLDLRAAQDGAENL